MSLHRKGTRQDPSRPESGPPSVGKPESHSGQRVRERTEELNRTKDVAYLLHGQSGRDPSCGDRQAYPAHPTLHTLRWRKAEHPRFSHYLDEVTIEML